jgi:ABC-2 type transport system permease protein
MTTTVYPRTFGSEIRAMLATAHKEWIIFRRYPSWLISVLVWPVLFPIGYIFAAKALGGPGGTGLTQWSTLTGTTDYLGYIVVGSTLYMWLNITLWDLGFQLRREQMQGTLESTWLCPVWRIGVMLGAGLTKLGTSLIFLAITVVEFRLFFGVRLLQGNPALLLLILTLVIGSIYGIGLLFGSLVIRFKEANAMVFLVRGMIMIFCGVAYPLAVLPGWMQPIAAALPLTYGIRAIRAVALNDAGFAAVAPDLMALAGFAVVLPVLGIVAFGWMERRARRTGSLGQY